jgi:hypothetical protein
MPKSHLRGEVPDAVFNRELLKYLQRREANPDAKKVPAQFTYNGTKYYFESSPTESGYRVRRSADFVRKEQRRRENLNRPKLSSIEKMMVDNYYDEASRRGLQVDHTYPAKHGGMHHPSNLRLMQPKVNAAKGDRVGGNYKTEPFIKPAPNGDLHIPVPGAFYGSESGSPIVDRANENMRATGYAALMGMPLDLF